MVALRSPRGVRTARLAAPTAIILETIVTMTVAVVDLHRITATTVVVDTVIATAVAAQVAKMSKSLKFLRTMS
jgi:hypothetical protein